MKAVADTLGVSRSNLHERVSDRTKPRRRYHEAQDAALLQLIERLVAKRPTYGYRRITPVLNRKLRTDGLAPVNHKRVCLQDYEGAQPAAGTQIHRASGAAP